MERSEQLRVELQQMRSEDLDRQRKQQQMQQRLQALETQGFGGPEVESNGFNRFHVDIS